MTDKVVCMLLEEITGVWLAMMVFPAQMAAGAILRLREAALSKVLTGETSLAEVLEHTVAVDMPVAVPV